MALHRAGRDVDALEVFRETRSLLVGELGIEPSRELRELQQRILAQHPSLELAESRESGGQRDIAPLVGRERELTQLAQLLDDAFAGRGRLALLVGEPGIGKSRLAEEVIARAESRGATVIAGRCWEAGGAPPYWPWIQSLRGYVTAANSDIRLPRPTAPQLAQLLPELRELVDDRAPPPPLEPETARFHLFDAVSTFLQAGAEQRPLLIFIDDLHAADEPSLLLLRFLARQIGTSRILLIGALRDVGPAPAIPLRNALTELGREPGSVQLQLRGLDTPDVARLVELPPELRLAPSSPR